MKILDTEIDFNILDADEMERFENEANKVVEKSNTTKVEELTFSQAIRKECEIVETFIDNVFGKGTSKKVFKGKKDLQEHIQAFQDIVNEKVNKQKELEDMYKKYTPNRKK